MNVVYVYPTFFIIFLNFQIRFQLLSVCGLEHIVQYFYKKNKALTYEFC